MKISSIQKSTLLDYPGKIACIVFTVGCNFRCQYCHNPECVLPQKIKENEYNLIPEEAFFNFLSTRIGKLDGVSICGGEPTIQPDLYDFAKKIKHMGFLLKLDTNGTNAHILEKLLDEKLLDYVAIDIKNPIEEYDTIVGITCNETLKNNFEKCKKLLLYYGVDHEYRTTVVKGYHTRESIMKIAKYISGVQQYYIQNYAAGNTLSPDFDGQSFTKNELIEFQEVASQYLTNCKIRE